MKKSPKKTNSRLVLTRDDIVDIVEALLFSSSCHVNADWDAKRGKKFFDLASRIAKTRKVQPTKEIFFFPEPEYEEPYAAEIIERFPGIVRKVEGDTVDDERLPG